MNGHLGISFDGLTSLGLPVLRTVINNLQIHNTGLRQCQVDAIKNQLTTGPDFYYAVSNSGTPNICP